MKAERIRSLLFHSFPIFFSSTSTPSYFLLHFLLLSLLSPPRYALAVFPILGTRDTPQEPPSRKKKPQTSTHTLSLSLSSLNSICFASFLALFRLVDKMVRSFLAVLLALVALGESSFLLFYFDWV
jgi:hypothetical protein